LILRSVGENLLAMSPIELLFLSDAHLGEGPSLLNSDAGLAHFAEHLDIIVGGRSVDTLILGGDTVDQVMSRSQTYQARARAFFAMMLGKLTGLQKIVYLFGNHDLNLFRTLFCNGEPTSRFFVSGIKEGGNPAVQALKAALVGTDVQVPLVVANPLYIQQTEGRVYLFHHGHHVRYDLFEFWSAFKAMDVLGIDNSVLDTEVEFGRIAPKDAKTLEDFENGTFPFVTTFWRNSQDAEIPKQEKFYTWYHRLTHSFQGARVLAPGVRPYDLARYPLGEFGRHVILDHYFPALCRSQLLALPRDKPISFVYGDTHDVAFHQTNVAGTPLNIFNTGGWISYYDNVHPATAVYCVDEQDHEQLWECGFPDSHLQSTVACARRIGEPEMGSVQRAVFERLFKR
jgi:hypothetical protein